MRVALIRHGQSRATVDGVVGGASGCGGLTDLGRQQARALAARLVATGELAGATVLLSSTLRRAVETAQIVASALGLDVVEDVGLCELDPGDGDGLSWGEWQRRFGAFDLAAEPYRPLAPGGESWAAFGLRVGETLSRLVRGAGEGTLVAVCHGGVIEQATVQGLGLAAQNPSGRLLETVPNASITEWEVDCSPGRAPWWRLIRFGDAAHL